MKTGEYIKVGIKIPERFKDSHLECIGLEQRSANVLHRGFRRMGNDDPTLQDIVDNYRKVMKFDGCGPTTRKDINTLLVEYTLIDLNFEQTLEWVLDLAALNTKGGVSQGYE